MCQDQFEPVFKAKLWKVKAEGMAGAVCAVWKCVEPTGTQHPRVAILRMGQALKSASQESQKNPHKASQDPKQIISSTFIAVCLGRSAPGERKKEGDWFEREMWIAKNGHSAIYNI